MAHRSNVPQFGNWDKQDKVPYTVVFDKARKKRGGGTKMIDPNNPQQNPGMFPAATDSSSAAPRPSPLPLPVPRPNNPNNEPIGRAAVRPTGDRPKQQIIREEQDNIHIGRINSSSAARGENGGHHRINGNESNLHGNRGQRPPVRAARPAVAFNQNLERFLGNNNNNNNNQQQQQQQLPAKVPGKGGAMSSGWDGNGHGGIPVPKPRQRPPRGDETYRQADTAAGGGVAIPKFGDWDESDPQAASKFTGIFDQVKVEKNEAGNYVLTNTPRRSPYTEPSRSRPPPPATPSKASLMPKCCFPWW